MRYFLITILIAGSFTLSGQPGHYFMSHYSPHKDRLDNVCFDIAQDDKGLMYFATRGGITQFDGRNWDLIPGNGAIYSLQITKSGTLYWSGASGFGKVKYDNKGLPQLEKLSEDVKDVFQSVEAGGRIYFLTEQSVSVLGPNEDSITHIASNNLTGSFLGIFELFGMVYINTERDGIFKVQEEKLVRSNLGFQSGDEVIFSSRFEDQYLIGLADNRILYCREDLRLKEIKLQDKDLIAASVIVSGSWVNRDLFVLGTLRGGMVFVHPGTGKTQEIINYNTGLPDNEIFAMMNDHTQSIWAAHEYGFTRVAPYLPFRSFSHYEGLKGNLLCAHSFEGSIYVGTSLGLFKLEKENLYDEIVYYIDVEVPGNQDDSKSGKKDTRKRSAGVEGTSSTSSRKKGILNFLRRGRSKETEPTPAVVSKPSIKKVKKTERVLRQSHYSFRRVKGIEAKVSQLVETDGELFAAGLGGTYEITGLQARPLLEEPSRFVFSAQPDQLIISTYADEVKVFAKQGGEWKPLEILRNLDDQINYIFRGEKKELWLCALDRIYRLDIEDEHIANIQTVAIDNPNAAEYVGMQIGRDVVVVNSEGFHRYNRASNTFEGIDSISKSKILSVFAAHQNIWYRNEHTWKAMDKARSENLGLLNMFDNLRFISPQDHSKNLWIITGSNELYQFYGERFTPYQSRYNVILKAITNGEEKQGPREKLKFDEEQSALTFDVIQPDYLAASSIEYRYQLAGLEEDWSPWSTSNTNINYPYLPSGDYVLKVQARDIFGRVLEMSSVSLEVFPPYWRRPWFYALEFFFFSGLVLLSFRLSTRYRFISRILSLLTIIMLIQLTETMIGETFETKNSPVTDFFVQVFIAFLILPVEGYLRNLMLRSLDSKSTLYRFLMSKVNVNARHEQQEP